MNFILLFYYFSFLNFIIYLVPIKALFYIRPIFITIISLFFLFTYLIKIKIIKKIILYIINCCFFLIIGEYARLEPEITKALIIFSTIPLIFLFSNNLLLKFLGKSIIMAVIILSLYPGKQLQYRTGIKRQESTNSYDFMTYGQNSNNLTYSVDTRNYYSGNNGLSGWYDKQYWKFSTILPINGRVYFPKEQGSFPIVFVVHGNALAEKESHKGYDYLLKHLAQNGYVAVSIDENFLNGNWTNLGIGTPSENDARGFLILEHIKLFNSWNSDKNSKLYNKIDLENIGLVGHSRGGEAVSIAARYSYNYPIKAVMTLAQTDRQYKENIELTNISFLTIQGANDGDITSFKGRAQYNRVVFNNDLFNLKASYYIEGANHAQFNSDWGKNDTSSLGSAFYSSKQNLLAKDQQEIAKILGLHFFNSILKNKLQDVDFLIYPQKIEGIPDIQIINDYTDSSFKKIRNEELEFRNLTQERIILNGGFYRHLTLSDSSKISILNTNNSYNYKDLQFSAASTNMIEQKVLVRIIENSNIVKTYNISIPEAIEKKIFKTALLNRNNIEPNFQVFIEPTSTWDKIELYFPASASNTILLGDFYIEK